ncbi:MFS transporter [Kitasatospora viridis]|uniref:EmrB/QacA subfamily drug resistance transporter n=1 Tax=Kitasatospora viridis TaxID=281105 RepID=A0A561UQ89_9ACTN|nr:MFS transporter [Kitasatospora viridis]TWG01525.1 EmrB/QacA subfamily drug resistance transporter [Kitasatospora viridis]
MAETSTDQPGAAQRRTLILAICCMSLFVVGIDNTIVNVALPDIQHDLNASVSGLQWVISAYTVVIASLLLLAGSTGDRIGRRRTFQIGLALFTLGSLLCSLAPGLGWLIAARVVQAAGGSMLNPVAMGIITNTFTEPRERARAIGVWGGVAGVSMALGPVIGGLLVGSVGWRAIFWINLPVGLAAMALAQRFVPESRAAKARRPDPLGQLLMVVLLGLVTFTLIEAPHVGWTTPRTIGSFVVAALAAVAFVLWESRCAEPLIDPRFFRSVPFAGATVIAVCGFASLAGFLFLNTLYLQDVLGYSAMKAGFYVLPMAVMAMVCSPISGRLVGGRGPRPPLLVAGTAMAVSGVLLSGLSAHMPVARLMAAYVVFGIGFGMINAPITNTAVSGMPRSQAGVAAAVASTSRQTGQSLGVAVIVSVVVSSVHGPLRTGFASASHAGWWIIVGFGLVVVVLGILSTGERAVRTATRVAESLEPTDRRTPVSTGVNT